MRPHLPVLLALAFGLVGCGAAPIKLINSPMAPAATGEIKTEEDPATAFPKGPRVLSAVVER